MDKLPRNTHVIFGKKLAFNGNIFENLKLVDAFHNPEYSFLVDWVSHFGNCVTTILQQ